jgi:hypothetical protein
MRRLIPSLTSLVCALAATLWTAPAAASRPVAIATPRAGSLVAVVPHAGGVAGEVELRGCAARVAMVEVRARCALGPCGTTATADRRGRWRARMTIIRRSVHGPMSFRARYRADPERALSRVRLVLPPWALVAPYAGDPSAPQLAIIGDSLAIGTEAPLRALLPGWRVTSIGRVGRSLAEG